jgi:hypothetical protein
VFYRPRLLSEARCGVALSPPLFPETFVVLVPSLGKSSLFV